MFNFTPFRETSLIGQIESSKAYLVSRFGEPTICNAHIPGGFNRQSLYEWAFQTPCGPVMIYDYKEWEDPDFADNKVITWQVSGRANSYTTRKVHPVNQWVADRTGLTVADRKPPRCRPQGGEAHQLAMVAEAAK